jgi:hypothetical protein
MLAASIDQGVLVPSDGVNRAVRMAEILPQVLAELGLTESRLPERVETTARPPQRRAPAARWGARAELVAT